MSNMVLTENDAVVFGQPSRTSSNQTVAEKNDLPPPNGAGFRYLSVYNNFESKSYHFWFDEGAPCANSHIPSARQDPEENTIFLKNNASANGVSSLTQEIDPSGGKKKDLAEQPFELTSDIQQSFNVSIVVHDDAATNNTSALKDNHSSSGIIPMQRSVPTTKKRGRSPESAKASSKKSTRTLPLKKRKIHPLIPSGLVPRTKTRGRSPESAKDSSKKSTRAPPPKKPRSSPEPAPNTNSANRKVTLCLEKSDSWNIGLQGATKFRQKHGHCNIPYNYPPDQKLAFWAKRQRHQYTLYLKRDPRCQLAPDRIQALNEIDFCFDLHQIKWLQKFEELKAYVKEHGHCRVKHEKKLGAWLKHQKAQKKLYDDGQASFMTKSRITMLDSLGVVWRVR